MKDLKDLIVVCVDNGQFAGVAMRLARDVKKVYYIVGRDDEVPKFNDAWVGKGFPEIELVESRDDERCDDADLWVFPDLGFAHTQTKLEAQGVPVWGARMGEELEQDVEGCKKLLKALGLPVGEWQSVLGFSKLREHLKKNPDVYVKVSKFRGCFDGETDILTESGWKRFFDLLPSDKVATMSLETRQLEYVVPTKHIKYWHDGKMLHFKGRGIDALVTPNHRFWTKSQMGNTRHGRPLKWKYSEAESLRGKQFHIPSTCEWSGIETAKHGKHLICEWMEFLGWFLSEGSIDKTGPGKNKYRVRIAQSKKANPHKYEQIAINLKWLGYNVHREGEIGFSIYDKELWMELASTCYASEPCACCDKRYGSHNKKVPNYVRQYSSRLIRILLSSFRLGDGCLDQGQSRYYSSSNFLMDGIQELVLLAGKSGRILKRSRTKNPKIRGREITNRRPELSLIESGTDNYSVPADASEKVDFSGFVYDVTVEPHHTILVRRNGVPYWSGNSWETLYSETYELCKPELDMREVGLSFISEEIPFVVCKKLKDKVEVACDAYVVDGRWPNFLLCGMEEKGRAYLGRFMPYHEVPRPLLEVNAAFAPVLAQYNFRGFLSIETMIGADGKPYVTDPATRCPSPPGELFQEFYANYSEIIWNGANGALIDPVAIEGATWGAEVMIKSEWVDKNWQPITFPEKWARNIKLNEACRNKRGEIGCIPQNIGFDQCGGIIGWGSTPDEAIAMIERVAADVKGIHIHIPLDAFDDLKEKMELAASFGVGVA